MNTLVIVVIAACCLAAGYLLYGRWLAHKWGIDPNAKTPAVTKEDGQDYVPTDGWVVFAHQFSSIAGAGPVTGAIQAAVFGWVPVFLWIILGGIFFGAVTDFGALYASVKNEGKSMGLLIEQYIGKTGKKLFLLFCWLFTLIVTAAFADMVAGTFNAYETVDGVTSLSAAATVNGAAGSISVHCLCRCIWTDSEKGSVPWLETDHARTCLHGSCFRHRHELPAHYHQGKLVLHGIRLHFPRSRSSYVAFDGTA